MSLPCLSTCVISLMACVCVTQESLSLCHCAWDYLQPWRGAEEAILFSDEQRLALMDDYCAEGGFPGRLTGRTLKSGYITDHMVQ